MLQGVLTRFQTQWLLEGKFEEFTIDEYRIVDILGTGGMGWLYVGVNEQTGEKAAVKVISRHMDNDYLTRFKLEARAGLLLNHPNIVRTIKLGETDEILYVAMELVEGISLQELIVRQGSIPWPQACSLVAQAAAGLQHAHEKGMVHRDIKPGNLLVKRNGTVKVLDFGLALMEKDEDEFTLAMISGQGCVGTADYISPEQTIDSFAVGPRADIYSLGCTLYCALTGTVPFPGESVAKKLRAHRTKDARPVREIKPEVPAAVEQIVAKMMARKPDDRYATAADVADCASAARPPRRRVLRLFRSPRAALGRSPPTGQPAPPASLVLVALPCRVESESYLDDFRRGTAKLWLEALSASPLPRNADAAVLRPPTGVCRLDRRKHSVHRVALIVHALVGVDDAADPDKRVSQAENGRVQGPDLVYVRDVLQDRRSAMIDCWKRGETWAWTCELEKAFGLGFWVVGTIKSCPVSGLGLGFAAVTNSVG